MARRLRSGGLTDGMDVGPLVEVIDGLVDGVEDAQASDEFHLDVPSRFHDYSVRFTLLIQRQCPEATKVPGCRTWKQEFDGRVREGSAYFLRRISSSVTVAMRLRSS